MEVFSTSFFFSLYYAQGQCLEEGRRVDDREVDLFALVSPWGEYCDILIVTPSYNKY